MVKRPQGFENGRTSSLGSTKLDSTGLEIDGLALRCFRLGFMFQNHIQFLNCSIQLLCTFWCLLNRIFVRIHCGMSRLSASIELFFKRCGSRILSPRLSIREENVPGGHLVLIFLSDEERTADPLVICIALCPPHFI